MGGHCTSLDAGNVKLTYNALLEKAESREKERMKEEMGIAEINARAMAITTIRSESDCEAYRRICEEVVEEAHKHCVFWCLS